MECRVFYKYYRKSESSGIILCLIYRVDYNKTSFFSDLNRIYEGLYFDISFIKKILQVS